jgi:LmbE family N-acetylglucosaminyl deacetylase
MITGRGAAKRLFIFAVIWACLISLSARGYAFAREAEDLSFAEVVLGAQDRILILAPHPDDEVLGCGGIIQQAVRMRLPLKIVFLTYGDNNQWSFAVYRKHPVLMPKAARAMGLIRHDEALAADRILGIDPQQLVFLGYPDFRTINIWYSHWGASAPAKSMLTQVREVPYANAFRPHAAYKGEEIVRDLQAVLREFKPTKIFLSHPADHNGDHRALYLFTRVALWGLEGEINAALYPYLIHFRRWPQPKNYHPDMQLKPPSFFQDKIVWQSHSLSPDGVKVKYSAIKKHRSQFISSAGYLLSFVRPNELFGDFPAVVLRPRHSSLFLRSGGEQGAAQSPEELTDEERAVFVGIEENYVRLEGDYLVFSVKLSRPVAKSVGVSLYIFGYRSDRQFQDMPKLHISFGAIEHKVFDQNRLLPLGIIEVVRQPKKITIRLPLAVLGNPQRVLTSARTYSGVVPLDRVSWRVAEICVKE